MVKENKKTGKSWNLFQAGYLIKPFKMIIIFSSIGLFGHKVFMMNVKQINSLYRQTATLNIESINQFVLLHLQVLIGSHMFLS